MSNSLFARLALADVHQEVFRNIVSIRESQNLYDDLTGNPDEWLLAQQVEDEVKPPPYRSARPAIDRPFEDAAWFNVILWPFRNWQASRFSDGAFGVWYGSESVETTVHESAYHWYHGLLRDAGFDREAVIGERKVYAVACDAALLDLRPAVGDYPSLVHRSDYTFTQSVGARIHHEGHPGLIVSSVRRREGDNYAVFNPAVLSNPRLFCQLTYRLTGDSVVVEKQTSVGWLRLAIEAL
ncbi:MAG: RES family NAD+ phosphorylase [Candidatus Accumulibacter sp.]|nr:RES family NAD+ phosphorylase [Accumulibacter sp.]